MENKQGSPSTLNCESVCWQRGDLHLDDLSRKDTLAENRLLNERFAEDEIDIWRERCRKCPDDWELLWTTLQYARSYRVTRGLWRDPPTQSPKAPISKATNFSPTIARRPPVQTKSPSLIATSLDLRRRSRRQRTEEHTLENRKEPRSARKSTQRSEALRPGGRHRAPTITKIAKVSKAQDRKGCQRVTRSQLSRNAAPQWKR